MSKEDFDQFIRRKICEPLHVTRSIVGWSAAGLGVACTFALILGMKNVIHDTQSMILHRSAFRWLAEVGIGGVLVAAIAFWRFK